jgi:anti-sigma regulatory factor (Ser/Thr protein kinase)
MGLTSVGRPRRAEWTGPPFTEAVRRVRREVYDVLTRWRLPADAVEDATLVVAELLANVVEHARTTFRLVVELRGRLLRVAVDDGLRGAVPAPSAPNVPGYISGLQMVNRLALRWGWQEHDGGKTVWAEFFC